MGRNLLKACCHFLELKTIEETDVTDTNTHTHRNTAKICTQYSETAVHRYVHGLHVCTAI